MVSIIYIIYFIIPFVKHIRTAAKQSGYSAAIWYLSSVKSNRKVSPQYILNFPHESFCVDKKYKISYNHFDVSSVTSTPEKVNILSLGVYTSV